jgi:hypothetical protein
MTPLHVLGPFVAHYQEVECIYVANGTCFTCKSCVSLPTGKTNTICTHIYILPADDELQMDPKHVDVW